MARQRTLYEILEDHELGLKRMRATLARVTASGVTDHGALTGLGDDDHTQYHTDARAATWHSGVSHDHGGLAGLGDDDHSQYHTDARAVTWHSGVSHDHGALTGLGDDDHTQYHTDARGDARYLKLTGGTLSGYLFTSKVHTGGSVWTVEPWSASTIELGNYGSIGTQGSFALDLAWNYERNTSSTYTHKNVNSYASAGGIRIGSTGILFFFDSSYGATSTPTTRLQITTAGALDFKGVVNIMDDGVTRFAGDASYTNMHDPAGTKKIWAGTTANYYNGNNHYFRDVSSNVFVRFVDGTLTDSVLQLRDGLTNVGNHETLRLNRGTGTTMQYVGYYSSRIQDPDTGKILKTNIEPLADHSSEHWQREWFMDLEPIKYDRVDKLDDMPKGYVQREIGFSIENLIEHTNLLTTKGTEVGGSPDEYALLAVTVNEVQHQKREIDVLTKEVRKLKRQLKRAS